jgi:hypothetical protein
MNTAPDQYPHFFAELGNTDMDGQPSLLVAALGGAVLNPPAKVVNAINSRPGLGWSSYVDPDGQG